MAINKNTFVEILEILESDGCIDGFNFFESGNVIKVYSCDGNDAVYNLELLETITKEIEEK